MQSDIRAKIAAEIRKTGFPLELRTAERMRCNNYYVAHSVYYVDKDEQKGREFDIRGLKNRFFEHKAVEHAVRHVLAVECKKSVSRPWVFFCSKPVSYDQNVSGLDGSGYSGLWFRGGHRQWRQLQRKHPWFSRDIRGRAYFEPFSSGAEANATIVKALLSVVKASMALKESGFGAGYGSGRPNIVFYYPLVILEGDLFAARLRDGEIAIEEADSVPVSLSYCSPSYSQREMYTVLVVRESAFGRELNALDQWLETAAGHLSKHTGIFEGGG